jgi:hypothetical protein
LENPQTKSRVADPLIHPLLDGVLSALTAWILLIIYMNSRVSVNSILNANVGFDYLQEIAGIFLLLGSIGLPGLFAAITKLKFGQVTGLGRFFLGCAGMTTLLAILSAGFWLFLGLIGLVAESGGQAIVLHFLF